MDHIAHLTDREAECRVANLRRLELVLGHVAALGAAPELGRGLGVGGDELAELIALLDVLNRLLDQSFAAVVSAAVGRLSMRTDLTHAWASMR